MVIVDNGKKRGHSRKIMVRRPALQQLNDRAANTPDIRRRTGAGKLNDFWCHPVGGTNDLCFLVLPACECACRNSKVCELDFAVLGGEDVGAFDVSVDNTLIVKILQSLQNLCCVDADQVLGELAI